MQRNFGDRSWRGTSYNSSSYRGTGRGGFAPRRGPGSKDHELKPDIIKNPLGELLTTITNADLVGKDETSATFTITNCKYVASYNWLSQAPATILVPGQPPLWTPVHGPHQLQWDQGSFFRDPNGARFPSYPTEPAVQSVMRTDPHFPTAEIDIFACGSTMGHLLRFVRGIDRAFRMTVEVIGNTVFLVRKENSPRDLIPDVRGFGHTFPDAYTTWEAEVKGSEGHQRLIRYTFGGLECIIRFESDGYINSSPKKKSHGPKSSTTTTADLTDMLKSTSVTQAPIEKNSTLKIEEGGSVVPQSSLFDLKTRSGRYKKEIDMEDFLPILYLKQIPNFIVAFHNGQGLFRPSDIKVKDLAQDLKVWETQNKDALNKFSTVLQKIIKIAKEEKDKGPLDVYSPSPDRLEIHRQHGDGSHALPLWLRQEWAGEEQETEEEFHDAPEDDQATLDLKFREHVVLSDSDSDDGSKDFTACSADCGYCGKCTY